MSKDLEKALKGKPIDEMSDVELAKLRQVLTGNENLKEEMTTEQLKMLRRNFEPNKKTHPGSLKRH